MTAWTPDLPHGFDVVAPGITGSELSMMDSGWIGLKLK
jgi:hypothetical protein